MNIPPEVRPLKIGACGTVWLSQKGPAYEKVPEGAPTIFIVKDLKLVQPVVF